MNTILGLMLAGLSGGPAPDEVVMQFYDAVASGEGNRAVSCLGQPMLQQCAFLLDLTKGDESSVAELRLLLGMEITFEEVDTMTVGTFAVRLVESDVVHQAVLSNHITCGDSWIEGDTAWVVTVFDGNDFETDTLMLGRENGAWKLMVELF